MAPFIADKAKWPLPPDIEYWNGFPVRQPSLLFGGLAQKRGDWLALWQRLNPDRSEEHTSELQSLMRISYAVFCLKNKKYHSHTNTYYHPKLCTSSKANDIHIYIHR